MMLPVMEFMRRFLQHVLPTGFMKVRYYGFMGAKPRIGRDHVRSLIELAFGFEVPDRPQKEAIQPALRCPECGSMLVLRYVTDSLFGPGKGAG
ncbi:MAG: transposase [Desulfobacterales bacterium]|nr:transposase [Desulfobacterales bacterium]